MNGGQINIITAMVCGASTLLNFGKTFEFKKALGKFGKVFK